MVLLCVFACALLSACVCACACGHHDRSTVSTFGVFHVIVSSTCWRDNGLAGGVAAPTEPAPAPLQPAQPAPTAPPAPPAPPAAEARSVRGAQSLSRFVVLGPVLTPV